MTPVAMTIAGSDPSGGAGMQADLKTFHQHGVYGTSVLTLLTVQNTCSVEQVQVLEPDFVLAQLEVLLRDIPPTAAKTGALGSAAAIELVAGRAVDFSFPLVVDPILISKHGAPLLNPEAVDVLRQRLLPLAFLVTPTLAEAAALAQCPVTDPPSMEEAAAAIARRGPKNVLVKGGHLGGPALDVLWCDGKIHRFESERIDTKHTHGTGCVYSAAITARLALGQDAPAAVRGAKDFIGQAIRTSPGLGGGFGPTNLFVRNTGLDTSVRPTQAGCHDGTAS